MDRTQSTHTHDLFHSGHSPQVTNKLLIPINNHRNKQNQNSSISELFCGQPLTSLISPLNDPLPNMFQQLATVPIAASSMSLTWCLLH
jgi:hypothetical protein